MIHKLVSVVYSTTLNDTQVSVGGLFTTLNDTQVSVGGLFYHSERYTSLCLWFILPL